MVSGILVVLLSLDLFFTIFNTFKLKKMDRALQTYEAFLTTISGYFASISDSLGKIAGGINPSGLTAADATQLQTDLQAVATAGKAVADAASAAAGTAAQGQAAPTTPDAPVLPTTGTDTSASGSEQAGS